MKVLVVLLEVSSLIILVNASCYIHNAKWEKVEFGQNKLCSITKKCF